MKKISISQALTLATVTGIAALLLAPKKGKDLRKDLKQGAKEIYWETQSLANNFVSDFKSSFKEADEQIKFEQEQQIKRLENLKQTIAEIEADLNIN